MIKGEFVAEVSEEWMKNGPDEKTKTGFPVCT
jgi:hypothetical protein